MLLIAFVSSLLALQVIFAAERRVLSPVTSELVEYRRFPNASIGQRSYPKFDGTRYSNPWSSFDTPPFTKTLKFLFSRGGSLFPGQMPSQSYLDRHMPIHTPKFLSEEAGYDDLADESKKDLELTWVGHSTVLLMMDGVMIMTDPMFNDFCSPFHVDTFRRYRPVPFSIGEMPDGVLIVLISHNHYDHLDHPSLQLLHRKYGDRVTFFVPKGLSEWFYDNISGLRRGAVVEMSWWQMARHQLTTQDGATIVADSVFQIVSLPAQHWSLRHPFNRNKSLWAGYAVVGPSGRRFYFAGDSGYTDVAFKEIGNEVGPFDVAAIPIGAYVPRDFMGPQHVDPQDAVQVHLDVKSKRSIGIHWGTFRLSQEGPLAPRQELAEAVEDFGLDKQSFVAIGHGETLVIGSE